MNLPSESIAESSNPLVHFAISFGLKGTSEEACSSPLRISKISLARLAPSSGSEYIPTTFSLTGYSVSTFNDVDTVNFTPIVGNVLKWNGDNWIPDDDKSNAIQELNDLNDVDTQSNSPSANKVLAFTGAEWSPLDLDTIITDINLTTATIGTANLTDLSVDFGTIPD